MKFSVIWRSSIKAIFKNLRRSVLSMIGIVIGIAAVITIISLGLAFQEETIKNLTNGKEGEIVFEVNYLPGDPSMYESNVDAFYPSDLDLIQDVEGVKEASFPLYEYEMVTKNVNIKGIPTPTQIKLVGEEGTDVICGRALTEEDSELHNKVVVIGSSLATELYGSPEAAIGKGLEIENQMFTIVGVIQSRSEFDIYTGFANVEIPENTFYDYFPPASWTYSIRISILPGYDPQVVAEDVLETLETSGIMRDQGDYYIYDTAVLTDSVSKQLKSLTYFLASIAGISLLIAGVGIMNMMYISVSERTKEIGIRRALGASASSIKMQFLLEGVTLTLIGGIIGYLIGILAAKAFSIILPFSVSVDIKTATLAIGISMFVGVVFSLIPASKASKKDLIDILK